MRFFRALPSLLLAAGVVAIPSASTAQSFFSTGASVVSGIDQHWTVSAGSGGVFLPGGPFGPAYYSYHFGFDGISNTPNASNSFAPSFVFRQVFDLTGYNSATADLQFRWACDDVPGNVPFMPQFSLNGGALAGGGTCGAYNYGGTVALNSGFVAGINTLDFYVQGNGQTDALGVSVSSFTADVQTVPEPATIALMATGLLGVAGVVRRRRRL